MYLDIKKIFRISSLIVLGISIGIIGYKIYLRYQAPKQTVNIVGYGEVDATTDQATISVVVKNAGKTQKEAQEANKADVQTLKNGLIALGIPESRITQSSYTPPIYRMMEPSVGETEQSDLKMPAIYPNNNLTITTTLTVVLDTLKNIETVFSVISVSPNAQIQNTYYSLGNKKIWESRTREMALKDARSQVESIAKINKLKVGKLVSITDSNSIRPWPMPVYEKGVGSQGMMELDSATQTAPSQDSEEVSQQESENVYYSEQTVKITASYTAEYELY